MSRTPTNAGLGIDLGSGGRGDGWRDGSQRKQDTPASVPRGLHGPRENTSMRGSAERTPRSTRPIDSASAPPPPPQSLPTVLAPAPLFSSGRQVSIDAARSAALAALTMAEGVVTQASVTAAETLRQQLRIVPSDEERLYPPPTMAPEDVGKTNDELLGDILEMLNDGQTRSMLSALAEPPLSEEEKERRRLKNKKKSDGRKAKKAAANGGGGNDNSGREEEGAGVVEENDVGDAKHTTKFTTPVGKTLSSINRKQHLVSLGYGSGGTVSPTPKSRLHLQLQSDSSPSPPVYTPTRSGNLPTSTSTSGFSIASPRQDTPRPDHLQPNTSADTPRKPAESSPGPVEATAPNPIKFTQYIVKVPTPDNPTPENPAPTIYCHRILGRESLFHPDFIKLQETRSDHCQRPPLHYFEDERICLKIAVEHRIQEEDNCDHCEDCKVKNYCKKCRDYWFAYYELKTMASTFTPEERKRIIEGNRSLRNIRTVSTLLALPSHLQY